jgi:uncharacterized OB-fold protein
MSATMSTTTPEHVNAGLLWEALPAGSTARLRASRCTECQRAEFPAIEGCPACGGPTEELPLGASGILQGCTEVLHAPPDAKVGVPYTIAVAGFPEANLAVMGLLDHHIPSSELTLGSPLEVCVLDYGAGLTYGFRPI